VWILADAAQVKQVIMNLVLNALHAMADRAGGVLALGVSNDDGPVLLTVTDNGIGIPPENLGRIFDPFFTTKGPDCGTGLGLSISLSIVRQIGGDISVDSRPGAGACFTVALPRASQEELPLIVNVLPPLPGAPLSRRVNARVLVVEDEVVLRQFLQELLRTHFGCSVDLTSHGVEALAALARTPYDLILSDIRMPVMNGTDLFLLVRADHPELARRFVFITGHPGEKSLEEQIASWGVPVVSKPFTAARLVGICEPYLRRAGPVTAERPPVGRAAPAGFVA
jgi:CheY-like chemotaxis protein/anti-sigma regulatory factor (Ser/Thr protein kinase)